MPWNVQRSGSKYEVVQSQTGRVVGTHATREEANAQLAALHANVHEKVDDGAGAVDNTDTINRRRQVINGSGNKKKKEDEQPTTSMWAGQFFPRRM